MIYLANLSILCFIYLSCKSIVFLVFPCTMYQVAQMISYGLLKKNIEYDLINVRITSRNQILTSLT